MMDNEAFLTEVPLKLFRVSLTFGVHEKGQSRSLQSAGGGQQSGECTREKRGR